NHRLEVIDLIPGDRNIPWKKEGADRRTFVYQKHRVCAADDWSVVSVLAEVNHHRLAATCCLDKCRKLYEADGGKGRCERLNGGSSWQNNRILDILADSSARLIHDEPLSE